MSLSKARPLPTKAASAGLPNRRTESFLPLREIWRMPAVPGLFVQRPPSGRSRGPAPAAGSVHRGGLAFAQIDRILDLEHGVRYTRIILVLLRNAAFPGLKGRIRCRSSHLRAEQQTKDRLEL